MKLRFNRWATFAIVSGLVAVSASTSSAYRAVAQDPIKIGVAVAQTSNSAAFGQDQVIGAKIAETFFNDRGGVNGRPIQIVLQDTAGDENGAINAFNHLIDSDKVVAILGPTLSQQAFAADPIADKAGVPVLGPSNLAAGIPQIGEYIGRISAPATDMSPTSVKRTIALYPNLKKVAVFYAQNDAFNKSETVVFQDAVKAAGLEIATVQTFQTTDSDFTAQITNALAVNPDLVIVSGLASDGGNLVRQLRETGYTGIIIGGNGLNTSRIFPICQSLCDGIILTQAYSYTLDTPMNNAFREAYKAAQGKEPPQFSAQAFSGIQVFVEALKAVDDNAGINTLDLAGLRKELNAAILAGEYETPLGDIAFTPEGEVIQKQFYVAQIKMDADGKTGSFVFLPDPDATATPEATASTMDATVEATAAK